MKLRIDSQQIARYYQILGLRFTSPPAIDRRAIEQIQYQTGQTNSVVVVAGNYRYLLGQTETGLQINSSCQLTIPETLWLAQQLSLCLNLPIKAIKSGE